MHCSNPSQPVFHLHPKDRGDRNVQGDEYGGDRRGGVLGRLGAVPPENFFLNLATNISQILHIFTNYMC